MNEKETTISGMPASESALPTRRDTINARHFFSHGENLLPSVHNRRGIPHSPRDVLIIVRFDEGTRDPLDPHSTGGCATIGLSVSCVGVKRAPTSTSHRCRRSSYKNPPPSAIEATLDSLASSACMESRTLTADPPCVVDRITKTQS